MANDSTAVREDTTPLFPGGEGTMLSYIAVIQCRPATFEKKALPQTVKVTLYRDGLKRYRIKK